ncbi:MAG: hypothetical protein Q6351_008915 [Candidatus Njordarchaeum guaymaensis]
MDEKDLQFHIPIFVFLGLIILHVILCIIYSFVQLIPLALLPLSLAVIYIIAVKRKERESK